MITVIILTYNEEMHLERCIKSLRKFSPDIVVVDSFSTDRTKEIAESLGARFYQNRWRNYSSQLNWGIKHVPINTEWTMRFDADEFVTDELAEEIKEKIRNINPAIKGIYLNRRIYFLGRWIRHGGLYPAMMLRIWRTGHGFCEERWMDEHIKLTNGKTVLFDNDLIDENLNPLNWWIAKHNSYASREAVDMLNIKYGLLLSATADALTINSQEKIKRKLKENFYSRLPLFLRAFLYWKYRYFFKRGFRDGIPGLIWHFLQGFWYRFLVDAKIYQTEQYAKDKGIGMKEAIKDVLGIEI